jgi:hypothetical protein
MVNLSYSDGKISALRGKIFLGWLRQAREDACET